MLLRVDRTDLQVLHKDVQALATAFGSVDSLEHGRHLARLDRLQDLDDGLEVGFLGEIVAVVHRHLKGSAQRTLSIASPQQLADLTGELAHLGFADLRQRRVEGRGVEVGGGLRVQRVDVDGAPVVGEGGGGDLLDY